MSAYIKQNQHRVPVQPDPLTPTYSAITGSAPQVVNGGTLAMMHPQGNTGAAVMPGTLSAKVILRITANTLTITGKWQVSVNGTDWLNATGPNNAANVVLATGTGTIATTTLVVSAHDACYGHLYSRYVLTSGTASGGGAGVDEVAVSYSYRTGYPG